MIYQDYVERNGIASSISGGWKFIDTEIVEDYQKELLKEEQIKKEKALVREVKKEAENNDTIISES